MPKKEPLVYQFKITLASTKPPIWRRIQVPSDYTFSDLHLAIQDSMGWYDSHLHQFEIPDPKKGIRRLIGILDDEGWSDEVVIEGQKAKLSSYFSMDNRRATYLYDFGDNWEHRILLEKILPALSGVAYPVCVKGARACPPEDCGGVWSYENLIEIMSNPAHEEYDSMSEWLDDHFDPEYFDPEEVRFNDQKKLLASEH